MQDPFYVVKEEVLQSVQGVTALHKQWRELLDQTNTSTNDEFKWTTNELKTGIKGIEWDLADLEETISVVESNQGKFNLDESELLSRKEFVAKTRNEIQAMKEDLQSKRTKDKMESDSRSELMTQNGTSQGDRFSKMETAIVEDNEKFIQGQFQRQQQLFREQDQSLDVLQNTVGNLKQIGNTINTTLVEHSFLIEELEHDVNTADSGLRGAVKRVNKLIDSSKESTQWCIIITLILVFIALVVLVFYV